MFDEIRYVIEKSDVPQPVRLALLIVTKAASWLPWVFVTVAFFLNTTNFSYWLAFFLFFEGALLATLIYLLLLIVRDSLAKQRVESSTEERNAANSFADTALKGVIGNFAFYLFFLVGFIVLKAMGMFDAFFQNALERLK